MKKIFLTGFILLFAISAHAAHITAYRVYTTTDSVTNTRLNGNINNILTVVNGGLDNTNADTSSGFRFYEVLGAIPAAGTEGRMIFDTANNNLRLDNASSFLTVADLESAQTFSGTKTFSDIQGITINDDGANGVCATLDNDGTNHGFYLKQDGVLAANKNGFYVESNAAQVNSRLFYLKQDNASSTADIGYIHNDGTSGIAYVQGTALASGKESLKIESTVDQSSGGILLQVLNDHASSSDYTVHLRSDGDTAVVKVDTSTSGAHMLLTPVASSDETTEGTLYMDDDGTLMVYSNSAYTACNTASDFAEVMQLEGNKNTYNMGDVLVIGTENIEKLDYESREIDFEVTEEPVLDEYGKQKKDKHGNLLTKTKRVNKGWKTRKLDTWFNDGAKKVKRSSTSYDTKAIGVWCEKATKLDPTMTINNKLIVVSLIGLVKCNVTDEGGAIKAGDHLTTSSTKGHAMKADLTNPLAPFSIIGKAREDFSGNKGQIEIVVGI